MVSGLKHHSSTILLLLFHFTLLLLALKFIMADKNHPVASLTNIKFAVPVVLDMEKGPYSHWAELFKIHCRIHKVLDHIIPPSSESTNAPELTAEALEEWRRLDAMVLQWIYGTISTELLSTVPSLSLIKRHKRRGIVFGIFSMTMRILVLFICSNNSMTYSLIIFLQRMLIVMN